MYAHGYAHFSAELLYDTELKQKIGPISEKCHIYMIGLVPTFQILTAKQVERNLQLTIKLGEKKKVLEIPIPDEFNFRGDLNNIYFEDAKGTVMISDKTDLLYTISKLEGGMPFEVKYIGQAYGKDGSRNAIDRLKKHETMQKISLLGLPKNYSLEVLILEILPHNRIITVINPYAEEADESEDRIANGLNKLYNTTEKERVSLYEASLIRHFKPEFNEKLKDSFPSTNHKFLNDCYDKDFSSIISEICFDDFYYSLFSETVKPRPSFSIQYDLHDDESRKMFFSRN